ncbi:hypothetical protein R1flu_002384 [Riccia fluitans]|uniref:Uncharacterized protein n=1 Tax=Riccia fluitans TaxID=41844 RepID=A0ABD1Y6Y4_9MARC
MRLRRKAHSGKEWICWIPTLKSHGQRMAHPLVGSTLSRTQGAGRATGRNRMPTLVNSDCFYTARFASALDSRAKVALSFLHCKGGIWMFMIPVCGPRLAIKR